MKLIFEFEFDKEVMRKHKISIEEMKSCLQKMAQEAKDTSPPGITFTYRIEE